MIIHARNWIEKVGPCTVYCMERWKPGTVHLRYEVMASPREPRTQTAWRLRAARRMLRVRVMVLQPLTHSVNNSTKD